MVLHGLDGWLALAFHLIAVGGQRCAATDSSRGGRCSYLFSSARSYNCVIEIGFSRRGKKCFSHTSVDTRRSTSEISKGNCSKVRRKEGSRQGWLVKTQVFLFKADKLTQVRTLRHPETSTISFVSAITLCIRSDCFSPTARAPESSLRLSLWTAVPRRLLSGLHTNYCNQTQVILILHLTHLLTAVSWVFLPLQTSLNHAPLATGTHLHLGKAEGEYISSNSYFIFGWTIPLPPSYNTFWFQNSKFEMNILLIKFAARGEQKHDYLHCHCRSMAASELLTLARKVYCISHKSFPAPFKRLLSNSMQ